MSDGVAATLLLGVVAYAVFGGADFGAGFWDLVAGGTERGRAPRARIARSLAPVWEGNHVWLVYILVVIWTGFPAAWAAINTTVYLPLGLAVLGIVLRGSGFAFRKVVVSDRHQQLWGATFAVSSVVTPFFFGTVAGAVASGRVPALGGGDPLHSWLNPSSVLTGLLAVAICAYLAAVFLTADAERDGDEQMSGYFRRRAWGAAWATGALALAGLPIAYADAHRLAAGLAGRALPAAVVSVVAGGAALLLLRRTAARMVRVLASLAVVALIVGWGLAQYPYLLGTHTTIAEAAAPHDSLVALSVVFGGAVLLVVPSLVLLYVLQQREVLDEG